MSYEGYEQHICKNGHRFDISSQFDYWESPSVPSCYHCYKNSVWCNSVDDTNGENTGKILDFSSFLIDAEIVETCNLGHRHLTRPATYRIPSEEETSALRMYWDGEKYEKLENYPK